jgi:Fe/S biogenesis protein NfuA
MSRDIGESTGITLTAAALGQVLALRTAAGSPAADLRLDLLGRGAGGFAYAFGLVEAADREAEDLVLPLTEDLNLLVRAACMPDLAGTVIDFVVAGEAQGFAIRNPNPVWRDPLAAAVQAVIDRDINPGLAQHGGGVSLLEVTGDQAFIQLWGGCQGCAAARLTLKLGIERQIRAAVPAIAAVVDRTDHAGGLSPYFTEEAGSASVFGAP